MKTKTRSLREELLSTLSERELAAVAPPSETAIRDALEAGRAEASAAKMAEQLPSAAQTLRFQ